jgi:hypothetical protein
VSGLAVLPCVAGSVRSVHSEPGGRGVLVRRRALLESCLCLDGARLSTVLEVEDDGLVSCEGRGRPVPASAGRPVAGFAQWWDAQWQERAYRTHTGDLPGEERYFPGGWVPLFTCPCGDPWCLYTGVKQSVDDGVVTWHEARTVQYGDTEVVGRFGRRRGASQWEPPVLHENLLPRPVSVRQHELKRLLDQAALARPEWEDGERKGVPVWAIAGVPATAVSGVSWLRGWDRPAWSAARTAYSRWGDGLAERLDSILAEHDPLRLRASGLVDAESYAGVSEDLEVLMPPSALAQHAAPLLADYFAQVWGLKAASDSLSRVGEAVLGAFGGVSDAEGWESTRRPSPLRRWRPGRRADRD